jgi:hypothetical protein
MRIQNKKNSKIFNIKISGYNWCFLVIMMLIFSATKAQNSVQIKGYVKSTEGVELSNATIILHPKNSQDSLKTITNEKGAFSLNSKQLEDFSISVSYVGFDKKVNYYSQKEENGIIDVGLISLIPGSNMLSNVTLEAQKIQIKEDTVSYVVDSTMYRKNDNVESILKNLPGVQVDKDGTVTAQGKQVTKVKVNGKEFFNGDVTTATREINADMVDKIQIIDDYGDQAAFTGIKDGDPSKTMNIQLKKDKNKGYFGNLTAAGGTDNRYLTSLSINKFNNDQQISILGNLNNINSNLFNFGNGGGNAMMGGMMRSMGIGRGGGGIGSVIGTGNNEGLNTLQSIGINYRDTWGSKVEVYGSYSFTDKETKTLKNSTQQTFFQDKTSTYIQQSDNDNLADNQRFSFNVEYKIDSMNYIKFNPTVTYNITNYNSYSDFISQINKNKISDGLINDGYITIAPNLSGNLLYNHRFKKKGRTFSLNINGGKAENNGDEHLDNLSQFYNPGGISMQQFQYQHILQDNQNYNYGGKISYTEPLSKKRYLEFNYSYNLQYQDNNRKVYKVDTLNGDETYLDSLSNIYDNNYTTNRIGINIRTTEKKYNYTIGFSAQPAKSETNSKTAGSQYLNNLINFYPVVRFAYNFSKSRSLNINYNGNSNQPTNAQLQPVTDRSNQQFITIGNPNLKPEFTNTFSMRYNNFDFISGNVFFGNLSASFAQDKIVNCTKLLRGGVQETTYENANGYYTLFGFYNMSKPIQNRKYVFNLGVI